MGSLREHGLIPKRPDAGTDFDALHIAERLIHAQAVSVTNNEILFGTKCPVCCVPEQDWMTRVINAVVATSRHQGTSH